MQKFAVTDRTGGGRGDTVSCGGTGVVSPACGLQRSTIGDVSIAPADRVPVFPAPRPAVVGHRGAPTVAPENTPAAFAKAHEAGATWVELDARIDGAKRIVVAHDPTLADGRALVEVGVETIREAGVWTLGDVLPALPPGLGVDVEIKNFPGDPDHDESMAVVALTTALLADLDRPVFISSFNPMVLMAARVQGWQGPLGLLTIHTTLDAAAEAATELDCAVVCPHDSTADLDEQGVALAHTAGLQVMAWTVDDPDRMRLLAHAGVDAICTNEPATAVSSLR